MLEKWETMKYTVIYEQGETSVGAYIPDLPGCVAVGETTQEAEQLIPEAVAMHLQSMMEHNEEIPAAHSVAGLVEVG